MKNNGWGGKRKNQTGRPKGSFKAETKTQSVYIRVTPEEKLKIQKRAAKENLSVSEFILQKSIRD